MEPQYKLNIRPGATFRQTFVWIEDGQPINLIGWTARAHFRDAEGHLWIDMTTENGGITLTSDGNILLYISALDTIGLQAITDTLMWDLLIQDVGGEIYPPVIEGVAEITPTITQWV